jgi:hypothetical protein
MLKRTMMAGMALLMLSCGNEKKEKKLPELAMQLVV